MRDKIIIAALSLLVPLSFVGVLEVYNHLRAGDYARPWVMTDEQLSRIRAMELSLQAQEQDFAKAKELDELALRMEQESAIKSRKK